MGMHWPLFGASGKPTSLCTWADHTGEAGAVQRKHCYCYHTDHPGEKRPPRKITSPRRISSKCEPRSSLRPDPAYRATADGFLEKLPGEGGNDDCRNHRELWGGRACPLRGAGCEDQDDRIVPRVDAIGAHPE